MLSLAKKVGGHGAVEYYLAAIRGQGWFEPSTDGGPRGRWVDPHGLLSPWGIRHGDLIDDEDARDLVRQLARGYAPTYREGMPLARNAGHPRRVVGVDGAYSTPKTVSVVWAGVEDASSIRAAIEQAMLAAADRARALLQKLGGVVRRGKGGLVERQGLFCGACFVHADTRLGDPSLHVHDLQMNPARDPLGLSEGIKEFIALEGRDPTEFERARMGWYSIESKRQFQLQKVGGAAFRVELAWQLANGIDGQHPEVAFLIHPRTIADWQAESWLAPSAHVGSAIGERDPGALFDLVGIDSNLVREFSQRCKKLHADYTAMLHGAPVIAQGAWKNTWNRNSRQDKKALRPEGWDWRREWHDRLFKLGFDPDRAEACARMGHSQPREALSAPLIAARAEAELLAREHVHLEVAIWQTVLSQALGHANLDTAIEAHKLLIADGVIKRMPSVEHNGTRSFYLARQLDQEQEAVTVARQARGTLQSLPPDWVRMAAGALREHGLTEGVAEALATRAMGRDGVVCVEGGPEVVETLRNVFDAGGEPAHVVGDAHTLPYPRIAEALARRQSAIGKDGTGDRLVLVGANVPVDAGGPSGFAMLAESIGFSIGEPTAHLLHTQGHLRASADAVEEAADQALQAALRDAPVRRQQALHEIAVVTSSRAVADAVNQRLRDKLQSYGLLGRDIGVAKGERGPMPVALGDLLRLPDGSIGKVTYAEADPRSTIINPITLMIVWAGSRHRVGDTAVEKPHLLRHAWADQTGGICPARRADAIIVIPDHRATSMQIRVAWRMGQAITVLADRRLLESDEKERRRLEHERDQRRSRAERKALEAARTALNGDLADLSDTALIRALEDLDAGLALVAVAESARRAGLSDVAITARTAEAAQVAAAARATADFGAPGALHAETTAVQLLSRTHPQSLLARISTVPPLGSPSEDVVYVNGADIDDPEDLGAALDVEF